MVAIEREVIGSDANGRPIVRAFIVADTTPGTLPTTGADVDNLDDADQIGVFSILYVVSEAKIYIANTQGAFVLQE